MENSQLQHLGKLLTGGEDNAKLAREVMIGQGIWDAQGVISCLDKVEGLIRYNDLDSLRDVIVNQPGKILGYGRNDRLCNMVRQWFSESNHHNPTAPTAPTQTSAFGPSGA